MRGRRGVRISCRPRGEFPLPLGAGWGYIDHTMNSLAIEAEVDSLGWLNIRAPAPPGTPPGKLEVVVVWAPPVQATAKRIAPRAGTLPGQVELAADFHAPLADFRPYSE